MSPAAPPDPRLGRAAGRSTFGTGLHDPRALPGASAPGRSIGRVVEPKLEIQMLHDRVMIKKIEGAGERRSSAGIVIPATAQVAKRLVWGEVVGVGQHVRTVKPGDRVLLAPEDQYEVEVGGVGHLVMRERDLHAVASEASAEHGTGLYL
jgi:chaperonin GroES